LKSATFCVGTATGYSWTKWHSSSALGFEGRIGANRGFDGANKGESMNTIAKELVKIAKNLVALTHLDIARQVRPARPCSAPDLFHSGLGLQCGNCGAHTEDHGRSWRSIETASTKTAMPNIVDSGTKQKVKELWLRGKDLNEISEILGMNITTLGSIGQMQSDILRGNIVLDEDVRRFGSTKIATSFHLGQVVATPGALEALEDAGQDASEFLRRHNRGDWGDVGHEDKKSNDDALNPKDPQRLLSSYKTRKGVKIWVITEWDRSVTTVLLPDEY